MTVDLRQFVSAAVASAPQPTADQLAQIRLLLPPVLGESRPLARPATRVLGSPAASGWRGRGAA
ncbi:hypothetical protein [Solwaraspora sp. WMMD792]|uniref:hypothetical protein n=1 Tax=Solwaraspora sp. WMMD792 TaxID=3016099 RepID=UPI002415B3E2|nr:hypothetical protein [Solwaraspora sp. WMMD792]MDG4768861.1 hypothetical protein [Solwaraspora sp. WMMD792]MDG4769032.1 hypothetical protein [Solwaraspora sp. WMMD792]